MKKIMILTTVLLSLNTFAIQGAGDIQSGSLDSPDIQALAGGQPQLIFGKVTYKVTKGSDADRIGCHVINASRNGFGLYQDAYNQAVKNCQTMYNVCSDKPRETAWTNVYTGADTAQGDKTCVVEAAVYGQGIKPGAASAIAEMERARVLRALQDQ